MYYELNIRQRMLFIKKYLDEYATYVKGIYKISCVTYKGIKEYLINDKYLLKIIILYLI